MYTTSTGELLTVKGAAERLGVSERTVRRWASSPDVALTKRFPVPGRLRLAAAEVDALKAALDAEAAA